MLKGSVKTAAQKREAEALAKKVPNVQQVVDVIEGKAISIRLRNPDLEEGTCGDFDLHFFGMNRGIILRCSSMCISVRTEGPPGLWSFGSVESRYIPFSFRPTAFILPEGRARQRENLCPRPTPYLDRALIERTAYRIRFISAMRLSLVWSGRGSGFMVETSGAKACFDCR